MNSFPEGTEMKQVADDHRTRVTKMMIRRAFLDLLKEKPVQNISVMELCKNADINRGTFYTHYTDIYDLLSDLEEGMKADFQKALEAVFDGENGPCTPVAISTGIFQCLKENVDLCTITLGKYGDQAFAMEMLDMGRKRCMETYQKYFKSATPKEIEYFYAFVSSGCMGLLKKWMESGMEESPEVIAEAAEAMILSGVGFFRS